MQKVTFTFPTYDSLWLFKEKTKAINVKVVPKKNLISGLFQAQEIEMAKQQFQAVAVEALQS
jgi:hypothetical protein